MAICNQFCCGKSVFCHLSGSLTLVISLLRFIGYNQQSDAVTLLASVLRFTCRLLESWLDTIGQATYVHLCASVTKQYNLVLAKGVISLAGLVTVGLVESNGSLPPGS